MNYDEAKRYANNLLHRVNVNFFTIEDVVHESYCKDCYCPQKMQDMVLTEKRRNKKSMASEKICTQCHEIKTVNEYYTRTDYRTNFIYQVQPCKECFKINYEKKKKLINFM